MEMKKGMVLKVQMSARFFYGQLVPQVQLLNLTPTLDICVEHRSDPSRCFSGSKSTTVAKEAYDTEEDYKTTWQNVMSTASLEDATNEDSVVIHNVAIQWIPKMGM